MKSLAWIEAENAEIDRRIADKRAASIRRLIGRTFGKLTVTDVHHTSSKHKRRLVVCRCECGVVCLREPYRLINKVSVSCGCQRGGRTHGHARHIGPGTSGTYLSWRCMRQRCEVPSAAGYLYYGGRGIKVCERWQTFENFLADLGVRPEGMTLDRIDPDGNYEPGNCRWATRHQQQQHTSQTKLTPDLVNEIRGRIEHGETLRSVGARLAISEKLISTVWRRVTWKDIP